jgi:hypothetical protein
VRKNDDARVAVTIGEDVVVLPLSEMVVPGWLESDEVNLGSLTGHRLLEPLAATSDLGFMVAHSLVSVDLLSVCDIPVRVMNLNNEPVIVRKGVRVGTIHPVEGISAPKPEGFCATTQGG